MVSALYAISIVAVMAAIAWVVTLVISWLNGGESPRFARLNRALDAAAPVQNAVAFFATIASLVFALAAFQASQEGGEEQLNALNASREALESTSNSLAEQLPILDSSSKALNSVVEKLKVLDDSAEALGEMVKAAKMQQGVLDATLEVSRAQLSSNKQQWKEEQERLSRRGKIRLLTGNLELTNGNQKTLPVITIARGDEKAGLPIRFSMQNIGLAIGREVFFIAEILTDDANVNLHQEHGPLNLSGTPKVLQVDLGKPVLPYRESKITYGVALEVVGQIPAAFGLRVRVFGEGIDTLETAAAFVVIQ
jgi:hypothetical protein